MSAKLEITLTRSMIGRKPEHRKTIEALGLKKRHQTVVQQDNEAIRGMVNQVRHLVDVKKVEA
jgi:large subunit ribosomal protein L30